MGPIDYSGKNLFWNLENMVNINFGKDGHGHRHFWALTPVGELHSAIYTVAWRTIWFDLLKLQKFQWASTCKGPQNT